MWPKCRAHHRLAQIPSSSWAKHVFWSPTFIWLDGWPRCVLTCQSVQGPGMSVLLCVWDCVGVSSSKCCRLLSKAKDERSNQHICKVLNEFQKLPLFLKGLLKNGTKSAARLQCNPRLGFSSMHPQPYRDPVSLFSLKGGRNGWDALSQDSWIPTRPLCRDLPFSVVVGKPIKQVNHLV